MSIEQPENKLLERLRKGDSAAFDEIYLTYADLLASKLQRLIKLSEVVEEVHQDVFMRLWNNRERIEEDTNIKAYLFTIAKNLSIDFYRKAAKDNQLERELVKHIALSYDHVDALVNSKETLSIVEKLISTLPPQRQKVFRMIKLEGKSYADTAAYFGVSISTVKDHMAKSIELLKYQLNTKYPHLIFAITAHLIFG